MPFLMISERRGREGVDDDMMTSVDENWILDIGWLFKLLSVDDQREEKSPRDQGSSSKMKGMSHIRST